MRNHKLNKSLRAVHDDERGLYVVRSGNVYRPYRATKYGIGSEVRVTPVKSLRSALVGDETWRVAETDVLWRSDGLVR